MKNEAWVSGWNVYCRVGIVAHREEGRGKKMRAADVQRKRPLWKKGEHLADYVKRASNTKRWA